METELFLKILVLIIFFRTKIILGHDIKPYSPGYQPEHYYQSYEKTEVHLHKLCSWNVLEWEDPVIRDYSNNVCSAECGSNYIPSRNVPTAFAFHNDRVFVGVRRTGPGCYSTLNYFKMCDIVDGKCPKLRPYPSLKLTEFLIEECAHPDQVISVERFSVDTCKNDPKLWIFDTKGVRYKNKILSFGEPSLKIYSLKDDTLIRNRAIPSNLYDSNSIGIVNVIVHVIDDTCENVFAYLLDSLHGFLFVYSWQQDRFWRFDSPKFYGNARHSDFYVTTPSGNLVKYFPDPHIFEASIDLCHHQLIYHARASLSVYAIDLNTLNNANTSIIGPTKFDVKYLGEKNNRGQTGSQAINNDLCAVWGIQEQNYAISCYNTRRPLTPNTIKMVFSNKERLPFLVDLKLVGTTKHVYDKHYKRNYESYKPTKTSKFYKENRIYVLTNNEKDINTGTLDDSVENFGIYYIDEDEALRAYPECSPYYKKEYQPPSYDQKPYMPTKDKLNMYAELLNQHKAIYETLVREADKNDASRRPVYEESQNDEYNSSNHYVTPKHYKAEGSIDFNRFRTGIKETDNNYENSKVKPLSVRPKEEKSLIDTNETEQRQLKSHNDYPKVEVLIKKKYHPPPPRKPSTPGRYNAKLGAYEIHREQYNKNYYNRVSEPYYSDYANQHLQNRFKKENDMPIENSIENAYEDNDLNNENY